MIRDSVEFTLLDLSQTIVANGFSAPTVDLKGCTDLFVQIGTGVHFGGGITTQQLDVYLQHSIDGGVLWQDIAHVQFLQLQTTTYNFAIRGGSGSPQSPVASSVAQLPLNQVVQGTFGDFLRLQWVVSGSPVFGFNVFATGVAK